MVKKFSLLKKNLILGLLMALACIITVVVGTFGMNRYYKISTEIATYNQQSSLASNTLGKMASIRVAVQELPARASLDDVKRIREEGETILTKIDTSALSADATARGEALKTAAHKVFEMSAAQAQSIVDGSANLDNSNANREAYNAGLAAVKDFQTSLAKANETAEAYAESIKARNSYIVALVTGVMFLASGIITVLVVRGLRRAAAETGRAMRKLADGDLRIKAARASRDEIGEMAERVNDTAAALRKRVLSLLESSEKLTAAAQEATVEASDTAQQNEQNAEAAGNVASEASKVSTEVTTVAAGAEEMGASIREIANNTSEAAKIATEATVKAERTNEIVTNLGTASQEISEVVSAINTIAEQTNLLALNATIEAARAGDAGKGFAVVAGEVKDLAGETGQATEDISERIEKIQAQTQTAVAEITKITEVIGAINDYQSTIASAVEEQSATTDEMLRSITEAATGSNEVSTSIAKLASGARTAADDINASATDVEAITAITAELREIVGTFKY